MAEEQLHDRATRGEALSAEEQAQLQAWYARLDREESAALSKGGVPENLVTLHTQIEMALDQLTTVTQRIQTLTSENADIRREIVSLQARLTQKLTPQPA